MSMAIAKATDRRVWNVSLLVACGVLTALLAPAATSHTREADTVLEQLGQVNIRALRLAIEDLAHSFPREYAAKTDHLNRLATIEKRLPRIQQTLARGDESALDETGQILSFQREALLANPLLDFDRLLLVKRHALASQPVRRTDDFLQTRPLGLYRGRGSEFRRRQNVVFHAGHPWSVAYLGDPGRRHGATPDYRDRVHRRG